MKLTESGVVAFLCAAASIVSGGATAAPSFDGLLDVSAIGAAEFIRSNPDFDGRGVAIAVLDSGVDMGVPGLSALPGGGPKVVEARDFTREATVDCRKASRDASGVVVDGSARLTGIPADAGDSFWVGFLDESRFCNSNVPDLNANGRTDDRFGVVVFRNEQGKLRALFDTDGDGDMSEAACLGTYGESFETALLGPGKPVDRISPLTVAVNLASRGDDRVEAEFHLATGAHGTHVAGIAAGNDIGRQAGWDGIAPGAVVLSLKIGHNGFSGGSTMTDSMRNALRFAADWGREHHMPVVVNISYGIGSEIEGQSDIDAFCEGFAIENPHVVIVTSAGNQGPGLSTVGTPAASNGVISVAALLTGANAEELTGGRGAGRIRVFDFSSRGGELAKPDVAAPGIAASTVPPWQHGDVMSGTSMASPQVAGAVALMLSALVQQFPDAMWNSGTVSMALKASARPVEGSTALDSGAGLINVTSAWSALRGAVSGKGAGLVQFLKVETDVPTLGGRKGGAAFWRAGGWAPTGDDPATVRVRPVFSSNAGASERAGWFDRFSLRSDRPWLKFSKSSLHFSGETDARFEIWADRSITLKPGIHVATLSGVSPSGLSFCLPVTVVVPWPSVSRDGVPSIRFRDLRVASGELARIPFVVPPGTGSISVFARPSGGAGAAVMVGVYDGGGHIVEPLGGGVDSATGDLVDGTVRPPDLMSDGTLELVLAGDDSRDSRVDLDIVFSMVQFPAVTWMRVEAGRNPSSSVEVVNNGGVALGGEIRGYVEGFEVSRDVVMRGDRFEEGLSVGPGPGAVEIEIEMSAKDWARFTDVAVNVLDTEGHAVVRTGFNQRRIVLQVPAAGNERRSDYTLQVVGGLAAGSGGETGLSIRVRHFAGDRIRLSGTVGGERLVRLYPGVRTVVGIEAEGVLPAIPGGAVWFGSIEFVDRRDGQVRVNVPVRAMPR